MKSRWFSFNLYLALVVASTLLSACQTTRSGKKEVSTLRLHLEAEPGASDRTSTVPIYRTEPMLIKIEKEPFLDEGNIIAAKVIDEPASFAIQVQFDRQGTWLLERATYMNKDKHLVIGSRFGEWRWLAAPEIRRGISNGQLTFTPDASREEADRIVRGLNVISKAAKKSNAWWKD